MKVKTMQSVLAAACGLLVIAQAATAEMITFQGTSGDVAASAEFEVSGNDLIVTLSNMSDKDITEQKYVLTTLFFDSATPLSLTATSAVVGDGSTVLFGTTDPGGVVGGEWAYKAGLTGAPENLSYGIGSAGLGLFGPGDRFPGSNLQGPTSPDGVQYGITSAGDDPSTGQKAVTGDNALIQNSVVFVLSGLPSGYDPMTQITGVFFQYGTALDDPGFHEPEPTTLALLALGGLAMLRRRRRPEAK